MTLSDEELRTIANNSYLSRSEIREAIRAVERSNFAIVPVEPTGAMLSAAGEALRNPSNGYREIYRAMLAANEKDCTDGSH